MNNYSDILFLSKRTEPTDNLIFLLRLSNYRIAHISDEAEAFNYLAQRQQGPSAVSLLLIVGSESQKQFVALLDKLDRCNAMLPILLINQDKPLSFDQINCRTKLKRFIHQCPLNAVHAKIDTILGSSS